MGTRISTANWLAVGRGSIRPAPSTTRGTTEDGGWFHALQLRSTYNYDRFAKAPMPCKYCYDGNRAFTLCVTAGGSAAFCVYDEQDYRTHLHLTGKLRDNETGLDFFGARYFSGAQGRFTTPDWSPIPIPIPYANLEDPQTLNLYAYVRNNPLSTEDVDGHDGSGSCKDNPKLCAAIRDAVSNGGSIDEGKAAYQQAQQQTQQKPQSLGEEVTSAARTVGSAIENGSRWVNEHPFLTLGVTFLSAQSWESGEAEDNLEEAGSAVESEGSAVVEQVQNLGSGLQRQIELHRKKLADYIGNPDAFDNKGFLKNASPELRQKIIDSRIKSLESQIQNFVQQLEKLTGGK